MRSIYRNPKELIICIKDLVDLYLENLMTYEKLKERILKISEANEERFFKNGIVNNKIKDTLGELRMEVINKVLSDK